MKEVKKVLLGEGIVLKKRLEVLVSFWSELKMVRVRVLLVRMSRSVCSVW